MTDIPDDIRELFRKFGKKGGRNTHKKEIPPAKRRAIAKKAAKARWAKKPSA